MKLIFLLAFVGLAASASLRPVIDFSEIPEQLTYVYDAQIGTGSEEVSDDFSTVRMRFKVQMKAINELDSDSRLQRFRIQFTEANIRQRLNATQSLPKVLLPMSDFSDIKDSDLWLRIENTLKQPFEIVYQRDRLILNKIFFPETEPFWSVNLKKGFLQFLQFNFRTERFHDSGFIEGLWSREIYEMTTADECKSLYTARRVLTPRGDPNFLYDVEKAIDFNQCQNRMNGTEIQPAIWSGMAYSDPMQQQQQQGRRIVDVNNVGKYQISFPKTFKVGLVHKAFIRTTYTVTPFGSSVHGSHRVIALQKLTLVDGSKERAQVSQESNMKEAREGLRLVFPQEEKTTDIQSRIQIVKGIMLDLVQKEQIDMEKYEKILRVVRFHLVRKEQVQQLADQLAELPHAEKALKLFVLDILPQAGTRGSVQFLMQIVRDVLEDSRSQRVVTVGRLTRFDINTIFTKLSMQGNVMLSMLQEVMQTVQSDVFKAQLDLPELLPVYKAGWLCLASMVNKYYERQAGVDSNNLWDQEGSLQQHLSSLKSPERLREQHARRSEEFRRMFVSAIKDGLDKNDVTKTLALKMIKNSGLIQVYRSLRDIILDKETVNDMRKVNEKVQAIYATQKMVQRLSLNRLNPRESSKTKLHDMQELKENTQWRINQIEADLLHVFRNIREDPEVRIAAWRVLVQSRFVRQSVLNMLVQRVMVEPSILVKSYCIEHMSQISESQLSRYQHVRNTMRSILSLIKRREPQTKTYSRVFQGQLWSKLREIGFSVETDLLFSDKAFTPRTAHIRIDHQSMGRTVPVVEIAIRSEGLQQVLEKVFGPKGLIYSSQGGMRLLKRLARGLPTDYETLARDTLNILPRILKEVPNMDMSISILGNEVIYVKASQTWIRSLKNLDIAQCMREIAQLRMLFRSLTQTFTFGAGFQMPTPVGTFVELSALMSVDFQPRAELRTRSIDSGVELKTKIATPLNINFFKRIGSSIHVLSHGNMFTSKLQFNKQNAQTQVTMQLVARDNQYQVSVVHDLPASSGVTLLNTENEIVTFSTELNEKDQKWTTSRKSLLPSKVKEQEEYHYTPTIQSLLQQIGLQVAVSGKWFPSTNLYQAPCWLLIGSSSSRFVLKPTTTDNVVARHRLIVKTKEPTESSEQSDQTNFSVQSVEYQTALVAPTDFEDKRKDLISMMIERRPVSSGKRVLFQGQAKYLINDRTRDIKFEIDTQLPQDLKFLPRSLPIQPSEWIMTNEMTTKVAIRDANDEELGSMQLKFTTNPKLQRMMVSSFSEEQMLRAFPRMRKCLNESQIQSQQVEGMSRLFTPSCVRQYKEFNQLNTVSIKMSINEKDEIEFLNRPISQAIIRQVRQFLQPFLHEYSSAVRGQYTCDLILTPSTVDNRVYDLKLKTLSQQYSYQSIQLPFQTFSWNGVEDLSTAAFEFVKGGSSVCRVMNGHVRTFDDVVLSVPKSAIVEAKDKQCPVVVARDCSKRQLFQVSKVSSDQTNTAIVQLKVSQEKVVKIVVQKNMAGNDRDTTVKVDRLTIDSSESSRMGLIYDRQFQTQDEQSNPLRITVQIRKIRFADSILYTLYVKELQLQIVMGGPRLRTLDIRTSPFYHNKVCGLCGDYNSEKFNEFKGLDDRQILSTPENLFRQYIEPINDRCSEMRQITERPASFDSFIYQLEENRQSRYSQSKQSKCEIDSRRGILKSFWNKVVPWASWFGRSSIVKISDKTSCNLKILDAKVGNAVISLALDKENTEADKLIVYIREKDQPQKMVTIDLKVTFQSQRLPLSREIQQEIRGSDLNDQQIKLSSGQQHLTIRGMNKWDFVITASNPISTGLCNVAHDRELRMGSLSFSQFATKFTDFSENQQCRDSMYQKHQSCMIDSTKIRPFSQLESESEAIRFSNDALDRMTVDTQTLIPLSISRFSRYSKINAISMISREHSGKQLRDYLMQYDGQNIARITVSQPFEEDQLRVAYWDAQGSMRNVDVNDHRTHEIEDVMGEKLTLQISSEEIKVQHKYLSGYGLVVPRTSSKQVTITLPMGDSLHHETKMMGGLCQVNHIQRLQWHKFSPRALMRATLEQALHLQLESEEQEQKFLDAEQVGNLRETLQQLRYERQY